jgi:small subunit ribosomal protein S9
LSPLEIVKLQNKFKILVEVKGGGKNSQAEAIRHGIARALVKFNSDFKRKLKKAGFLKRDPRMKERKKPGLKRARRAPQWQKR